MQIYRKYKLEKAVSSDSLRLSLQNIFITRRHAAACNGTILAIIPITSEKEDTPGWLSPEALKLARKVGPKHADPITIVLNGKQILPDGTQMARPDNEDKPPRFYSILRAAHSKRKIRFGINASYLKDLADALGTEEVVLEFAAADKPILVRPVHSVDGERGVIMPVKVGA